MSAVPIIEPAAAAPAVPRTTAETALMAAFAAAREHLPGVAAAREQAFRRFESAGLPHRRVEAWKYTDLRALMREAKPLAPPPDATARTAARTAGAAFAGIEARRIVLVDGTLVPELSDLARLEDGLRIRSLASALAQGDPLVAARIGASAEANDNAALALNTAFMSDGVVIEVASGATLGRPLHLVFYNVSPAAIFTRSVVFVGDGARAMLVESHEGAPGLDCQVNAALDLVVGRAAHVDHVRITGSGSGTLHIGSLLAEVGAQARFNEFLFTASAPLVRNQLFVRLDGEGTVAGIRGATLLGERQHADATLIVDHVARACISREAFRTVLDGDSRGVFQGKIIVRPQAQKTDARMAAHALLLSESAEADTKPELEIFADDVQCGHGATAGALDRDLLFYLQARGIPAREAESLMIQAFLGEAIEGIEHAGLRDILLGQVAAWLAMRS